MIIFDAQRGEYIDTETGEVIEERVADLGPEWRAFEYKERLERERTGSPLSLKVHDHGLSTRIGAGSSRDRIKLIRMRRLHEEARILSSERSKRLVTYLAILNREATKIAVPEHVKQSAALIIRKLAKKKSHRKSDPYTIVIASLYYACKINNVPVSFQEFVTKFSISASDFWNAIKQIKEAVPELRPRVLPTKFIPKILDELKLPSTIGPKVAEIVNFMYNKGLASGKSLLTVTAGATYIVSILSDNKKMQKEIAEKLGITEATIRNRYREIVKALGPVRYVCQECGFELYRFEEVGEDTHGVMTPSEVKSMHDGKCPRCGHELGTPTLVPGKLEVML
ncbi:MAG: hypothetical protein JHC26_00515 [Thermofilum sp.]|uniref:transcription initiation factor IIB n=1 Tax=Thermofilum sp. TaxID=1961369 RepID=UPI00258AC9CC|nr:hypothetical protein [Thermofilum sp.]MCI4407548.1 hypothetical protein [Thermofilum sp.]